ncbi:MAG: hypothetical protein GY757_09315 [bacterium]|nr:hypothetical protein [bacterium]
MGKNGTETTAPFGEFATPAEGTTVSNSVPFTGWGLGIGDAGKYHPNRRPSACVSFRVNSERIFNIICPKG